MSSSQIIGATPANIAEVEAATKALRVTLRAEDYGNLGIYAVGGASGVMAAGITADSTIFSFRWTQAVNLALIKRFILSAGNGGTAFAAGLWKFDLFVARSFSVADSGGSSLLPTGNQNKLRTSGMGTTLANDIRISSTAALTVGTRTLDSQSLASVAGGVPATAGSLLLAPFAMFDQRPGEFPLVLAQNEGLVLRCSVPATGVWQFGLKLDYTEIAAY